MSQSLCCLPIHLIFSTKNREESIFESIRQPLHAYMGGILKKLDCEPMLINSTSDHVHVLFDLGRTVCVSQAVGKLKSASSKWMKTKGPGFTRFAWQAGYGAFAVSESNVQLVFDYIADQKKHHTQKSFQDEYRAFLEKHEIAYDERYVWE